MVSSDSSGIFILGMIRHTAVSRKKTIAEYVEKLSSAPPLTVKTAKGLPP